MTKPSPYRYFRQARRRAIVIQSRDPRTGELIDAADLVPFRALEKLGTRLGIVPAGALVLVTREVAEPILDGLEELPKIDNITGGRIIPKADALERTGGPAFVPG